MTLEGILDGLTFDTVTLKQADAELRTKEKAKQIAYFIHRDKITKEPMKDGELSQLNALVGILQILYTSPIGSPVSDDDYDTLQEMLIDMGIPRLTGSVEINDAKKVNHKYLTLRGSLHKIYYLFPEEKRTNKSRKYLHEWKKQQEARYKKATGKTIDLDEVKVMLTPKFDGVGSTFECDKKPIWLTRGHTGSNLASDVTHILNIFNDLYHNPDTGQKFEIMCSEDNWEKINKLVAKPYKNSRQIVTSILNSVEADFKADYLYPVPLRIMKKDDELEQLHPTLIEKFPTVVCKLGDLDVIKDFARENKYVLLNGIRFRTDGAVITILDPKLQKILGRDKDINNFEVAYKFTEEIGYSKVRDVEFYVSEFGFVTPVLVVNPLILKGNKVDHISLSNKERFDELFFSYGDDVKVSYDIIPYASRDEKCNRVKSGRKIEFPHTCPKCHEELEFQEWVIDPKSKEKVLKDKVQIQCDNPNCPSRIIGKMLNYCTTLRIKNIGGETLEVLEKVGLLNKGILSLYKLKKKTDKMIDLDGFGKLKTKKIIREIEAKRRLKDWEFFGAIGIGKLSQKTFKSIFSDIRYTDFLNMLKTKNFDLMLTKLLLVDGIKDKKAMILIDYLSDVKNRIEVEKLIEELSIYESYGEENISKGIIVISGFRSDDFEERCKAKGWEVQDTWVNKAKYLVIPDPDPEKEHKESSKEEKAKSANVPIIHLTDFLKRLPKLGG